jgi:putative DNA primase/helicase
MAQSDPRTGWRVSAADFANLPIGEHRFTHSCKENSRSKPLHATVTSEGVVWTCFRCGEKGSLRHARERSRMPLRTATKYATLSDYGRELWRTSRELGGDALEYLRARRCAIPPTDSDLRWHPNLKHPSGCTGPALVALVTDAVTNEPMSLHRTWIRADGRKASVDPPRLLLKDHKKAGCAIRLWPDESVTLSLAIAEGIETGLCASHGHAPVWSTIDAGNMLNFPALAGIENLVIFADHDEAGLKAANSCAERWASNAQVTIVQPTRAGTDFVDEVSA